MKRPILSVCIPVYNRAQKLKRGLESLLQASKCEERDLFEIIISDNASNDEIKEVIDEYSLKFINFKYFRQARNIGAERNFLFLVEQSSGQYSTLLGSDDLVNKTYFNKIFSIVKNENPTLAILNIENNSSEITKWLNFGNANCTFKNVGDLLIKLGTKINFISALVFDRDNFVNYANNNLQKISFFHSYGWSYFLCILMSQPNSAKIIYESSPQIVNEDSSRDIHYNHTLYFLEGMSLLINELSNSYGFLWKVKILNSHLKYYYKNYGIRADRKIIFRSFRYYYMLPRFWIILCVSIVPVKLKNYLYLKYKN